MKILGLIGGTSWVSTLDYYKYINEGINKRLGGSEFAKCILYSLNYGDIIRNAEKNDLEANGRLLIEAGLSLKKAGAEGLLLCANTMHMFAEKVASAAQLPIVHIATETGKEIKKSNIKTIALLGTRFTMEMDFYKNNLKQQGIETLVPSNPGDINFLHDTIANELGKGIINTQTKAEYIRIIGQLAAKGAEGVILGCTEIPLLINQNDVRIKTFDTTMIHAQAAVDFALS